MGELGSIPGWLLVPVAFVVLAILRLVSLVLGNTKPGTKRAQKGKVTPMARTKSISSVATETMWALGTNLLAGLPLLT